MISQNWSRENLAWLAGIIEGEGYISASMIRINVKMTDEDVILRAAHIAGCGRVTGPQFVVGCKPIYRWQVSRQAHAYALLAAMFGHFCVRRRASAEAAMKAFAMKPTREFGDVCGTRASYRRGCRCARCRSAVNEHNREMARRRKSKMSSGLVAGVAA